MTHRTFTDADSIEISENGRFVDISVFGPTGEMRIQTEDNRDGATMFVTREEAMAIAKFINEKFGA